MQLQLFHLLKFIFDAHLQIIVEKLKEVTGENVYMEGEYTAHNLWILGRLCGIRSKL